MVFLNPSSPSPFSLLHFPSFIFSCKGTLFSFRFFFSVGLLFFSYWLTIFTICLKIYVLVLDLHSDSSTSLLFQMVKLIQLHLLEVVFLCCIISSVLSQILRFKLLANITFVGFMCGAGSLLLLADLLIFGFCWFAVLGFHFSASSIGLDVGFLAPRFGDNANGNGSDKIRATQNFQKMGVKELRDQAILRGISTSNLNYDENNLQEEEESKKEKFITATKKGTAVLDHWIPDDIKATYHVLQNGWVVLSDNLGIIQKACIGWETRVIDLQRMAVINSCS